MQRLPCALIEKITLYNSTPEANIIKEHWRKLDASIPIFYDIGGYSADEDDLQYHYVELDYPRAYFRRDAWKTSAEDGSWLRMSKNFFNLPRKCN